MEPVVSVIIVTYNQVEYIGRAVDSVLAQRCDFPIEIIIGDDCSTDGTTEVCRRYAEAHPDVIRFFANKTNKGLIDNYFDCVLEARGRYLADCGGDDFWIDPEKLAKQVSLMEAHPEVSLCHTNWQYYDESTGAMTRSEVRYPCLREMRKPLTTAGGMLLPILTADGYVVVHSCTWMLRREVFMRCYEAHREFFRNKRYGCEDRQTAAFMAATGSVAYIDDVTLSYSVGKPSMTSAAYAKRFRFYSGTTLLSRRLQQHFGIADEKMSKFYESRLSYLVALAIASDDTAELLNEAKALAQNVGTPLPRNARIKTAMAKTPIFLKLLRRLTHP